MHEHFQRYFWTNIGIILGSFLVFGLIFYFFSQVLDTKAARVLADRTAIAQRSTDLENLNKLKTDTAAATDFQKKFDALLPSQDGLIGFPQFINNLARTHSLSPTFNYDGTPIPATALAPGYVDFSSSVEGEGAKIYSFLDELENKTTRFMVNLKKVVLLPRSGGSYNASISGRVYFQENKITTPAP